MFFYSIAFLITALDQLIKYLVQKEMIVGQSIPLIGHVFKLTYVRNTGAAFSLFVGFSPYLAAIGLAVAVAVIYLHYRTSPENYLLQIGFATILGGSLGNLIDRLFRFYVIDYLDITVWPVFNLADIMINVGVIMLACRLFSQGEKDASRSA
ncbi:MAG: signal peptidase II [Candidatus Margulisbacteria bacterium]|nr:signal peptidase II [Candidatus Margulisiibacteriota bacterium]